MHYFMPYVLKIRSQLRYTVVCLEHLPCSTLAMIKLLGVHYLCTLKNEHLLDHRANRTSMGQQKQTLILYAWPCAPSAHMWQDNVLSACERPGPTTTPLQAFETRNLATCS